MNKDKFLTVRWNNLLMLGLGIPALIYVTVVFFSSILSDKVGFFGIVVIGVIYCLVVEQHSSMTLVWQIKKSENYTPTKQNLLKRTILVTYNFIWWIPVVSPFVGLTEYRMGSTIFFFVTLTRAFINLYRVNILTLEKAVNFPLRIP